MSKKVTTEKARKLGNKWGLDWQVISLKEFAMGINVELEHSKTLRKLAGPGIDIVKAAASIALDHLDESPTYYTDLKIVEGGS